MFQIKTKTPKIPKIRYKLTTKTSKEGIFPLLTITAETADIPWDNNRNSWMLEVWKRSLRSKVIKLESLYKLVKVWWVVCKWQVEYVLNYEIEHVLRCCVHWGVNYESHNRMTVRPSKGDELMCNEYCDGIHCGYPTSLITLARDELKLIWEQLRSRVFCIVHI